VVELAGEHDVSTAPRVDAAFARTGTSGGTVVVDFTQTSFIDSTVVGGGLTVSLRTTVRSFGWPAGAR
jgi:anti-anti-sigma regulatory factor